MCQKQHGAAFATYVSVPKIDLVYRAGQESLVSYRSSESVTRKFCRNCGSNIEWKHSGQFKDWASVPAGTLDTVLVTKKVVEYHEETKACWLKR